MTSCQFMCVQILSYLVGGQQKAEWLLKFPPQPATVTKHGSGVPRPPADPSTPNPNMPFPTMLRYFYHLTFLSSECTATGAFMPPPFPRAPTSQALQCSYTMSYPPIVNHTITHPTIAYHDFPGSTAHHCTAYRARLPSMALQSDHPLCC